ncbi:sugar transferase [Erythrobacter sp.]|nr:sugar transferase [Erythrobacter sp.]
MDNAKLTAPQIPTLPRLGWRRFMRPGGSGDRAFFGYKFRFISAASSVAVTSLLAFAAALAIGTSSFSELAVVIYCAINIVVFAIAESLRQAVYEGKVLNLEKLSAEEKRRLGRHQTKLNVDSLVLLHRDQVVFGLGNSVMKRGFDIAVSVSLLLFLMPLFFTLCMLIKFDSKGPIFFKNPTIALNGSVFSRIHFRSMRHTTEEATENSNRITRVGYFIRRTGIDTLPELFNVLRGDMSIVGPQPMSPTFQFHDDDLFSIAVGYYRTSSGNVRLVTRPGMVHHSSGHSIDRHPTAPIAYDIYDKYVKSWSIGKDMILLMIRIMRLFR